MGCTLHVYKVAGDNKVMVDSQGIQSSGHYSRSFFKNRLQHHNLMDGNAIILAIKDKDVNMELTIFTLYND